MKKAFIEVVFIPPQIPVKQRFDAERFKMSWDGGVLKLKEGNEPVLMIPGDRVQLVQFGEEEVESQILTPGPMAVPPNLRGVS